MARWNKDRRVLEHEHSEFWKYRLVEADQPNLQREVFPYNEVPRLDFDHKYVVTNPAKRILISDSTFRDGQQARPPYSVKQIVNLYDILHRIGGPRGIIRQSEFFLYSRRDREAVEKCLELGHDYPEVTAWIAGIIRLSRSQDNGWGTRTNLPIRLCSPQFVAVKEELLTTGGVLSCDGPSSSNRPRLMYFVVQLRLGERRRFVVNPVMAIFVGNPVGHR